MSSNRSCFSDTPCAPWPWLRSAAIFVAAAFLLLALPGESQAQDVTTYFKQNCSSCHTIGGGRMAGPDLKDVSKRRERVWLRQFIPNPKAIMDKGDPYALKLLQSANGVIMPPPQNLTEQRVEELLNFIDEQSKLGKSVFGGGISDRPYTPAELEEGKAYFAGIKKLMKGGPPCISCHTLGTVGGLGGGRLAPAPQSDLTRVYERLGGRKAVGNWLNAPPTPTMQAVFKNYPLEPDEIFVLLAAVEDAHTKAGEADVIPQLNFFLLGLGGAVVGLVSFGTLWRNRFRAVRRPLVHGQNFRGER